MRERGRGENEDGESMKFWRRRNGKDVKGEKQEERRRGEEKRVKEVRRMDDEVGEKGGGEIDGTCRRTPGRREKVSHERDSLAILNASLSRTFANLITTRSDTYEITASNAKTSTPINSEYCLSLLSQKESIEYLENRRRICEMIRGEGEREGEERKGGGKKTRKRRT